MKTSYILPLLISTYLSCGILKGNEVEALEFVGSDSVASKLVADFDFMPHVFAQTDTQSKDETLRNDRYFTTYTLLAASRSRDSEVASVVWSHWVEVKIEKSASSAFMNVRGVSFVAIRAGDALPCFFTEKVYRLNKSGEVREVITSEKTPAEQAGTGQPATRTESKSEDSDKPQPEAEGRSR
jgi:hypothetical protein